jgi:hypothetical protein
LHMRAGVGCTDTAHLTRVATEMALGDPLRGIDPWDMSEFGDSAKDFIKYIGSVRGTLARPHDTSWVVSTCRAGQPNI